MQQKVLSEAQWNVVREVLKTAQPVKLNMTVFDIYWARRNRRKDGA